MGSFVLLVHLVPCGKSCDISWGITGVFFLGGGFTYLLAYPDSIVVGTSCKSDSSIFERDCGVQGKWDLERLGRSRRPSRLICSLSSVIPYQTWPCGKQRLWGRWTVLGIKSYLWERSCCRGAVSLMRRDPAWVHVTLAGGWGITKYSWDGKWNSKPFCSICKQRGCRHE